MTHIMHACCVSVQLQHQGPGGTSALQERGAKEGHTNEYDELHAAGIDIPGRLTLNLWRLLRTELKLGIYTQVQPGLSCFVRPLKAANWQRRFQTLPSLLSKAGLQQLPSWQQSMCSGVETKHVIWSCYLVTGVHGSGGAAAAAAAGAAAPGLPLVRRRASRCTQRLCASWTMMFSGVRGLSSAWRRFKSSCP